MSERFLPDDSSRSDDDILAGLDFELSHYDQMDLFSSNIHEAALELESPLITPDQLMIEGRDIPFGPFLSDQLNYGLFSSSDGSYRGFITIQPTDDPEEIRRLTRVPQLKHWLPYTPGNDSASPKEHSDETLIDSPLSDTEVIRLLERLWPVGEQHGNTYDNTFIRQAAPDTQRDHANDILEIITSQLAPEADITKTIQTFRDIPSQTVLEIERSRYGNGKRDGYMNEERTFRLSLQRTLTGTENGDRVNLITVVQIDEYGNIAIEGYKVNTNTNQRSARHIRDMAKCIAFLTEGLDKLVAAKTRLD